jgi:YhcH/YjgK/YiaL family protein
LIFDDLARAGIYRNLGPRFAAGFDYLSSTDLLSLADGRYSILGSDVFAIVQTYDTKPQSQGRWEAHRLHADIQFVISGREKMGAAPLATMKLQPPYDPEKDVEFYEGAGQFFEVSERQFALFLPHDVHMPSIALGAAAQVKKAVIKVRMR